MGDKIPLKDIPSKIFVCKDCGTKKEVKPSKNNIFHETECLECDGKMYTAN